MAMLNAQVTVIQKCYRGSRVMDWRNLRMNHIARHVYADGFRASTTSLNRQKKFEAWQAELAKDSVVIRMGMRGELGAEWVRTEESRRWVGLGAQRNGRNRHGGSAHGSGRC